jgi:hypothetical protein
VTGGDRAGDVLVAAALLAARPDVKPDRIAAIEAPAKLRRTATHPFIDRKKGRLVASIGVYPGCGSPDGNPVILPLFALSGSLDDWTPAGRCVVWLAPACGRMATRHRERDANARP